MEEKVVLEKVDLCEVTIDEWLGDDGGAVEDVPLNRVNVSEVRTGAGLNNFGLDEVNLVKEIEVFGLVNEVSLLDTPVEDEEMVVLLIDEVPEKHVGHVGSILRATIFEDKLLDTLLDILDDRLEERLLDRLLDSLDDKLWDKLLEILEEMLL
jgi:hypothetical protein